MFRHRQPLRRWAAFVLLLWLFGVGAGVANACLLPSAFGWPGPGAASSAQGQTVMHRVHTSADAAPHGSAHALHEAGHDIGRDIGHDQPTAKSNCQDFCEKSSVSIAPLKSALDDAQGHALSQVATVFARPVPALASDQGWVPGRHGVRAPPPTPIAFLRLTL